MLHIHSHTLTLTTSSRVVLLSLALALHQSMNINSKITLKFLLILPSVEHDFQHLRVIWVVSWFLYEIGKDFKSDNIFCCCRAYCCSAAALALNFISKGSFYLKNEIHCYSMLVCVCVCVCLGQELVGLCFIIQFISSAFFHVILFARLFFVSLTSISRQFQLHFYSLIQFQLNFFGQFQEPNYWVR